MQLDLLLINVLSLNAHALLDQTLSHIRELFVGILYHQILPTVNLLVNLNNNY